MHLIFFDLDGTLLNDASEISAFTKDTLSLLRDKEIAYSVATGRTKLSAQPILNGHNFDLPHIYNNGVTVWNPKTGKLSFENLLNDSEISTIIDVARNHSITPFIQAIDIQNQYYVFHPETQHDVENKLIDLYQSRAEAIILPLVEMMNDLSVTNISMVGEHQPINEMWRRFNRHENLVAYSGPAMEGDNFSWIDIHHCNASKGTAVVELKRRLGASNVICFGDSTNDLSMLKLADESYAPQNAKEEIKQVADKVIGSNDKDGIAHFLRERFSL
ncbi:MAG: Cof-type HAD-IIB family hydrolase [Acidiferrobacterales bacterium]|nr:Cof-type HAD-IIB family hydrolase [Acidiferrobacterales bacterium]